MKSERRFFPCSAQASHRRIAGIGSRALVESRCLACGQTVDTLMDQALEPDKKSVAFPDPLERMSGKAARKRPPTAIHLEKLLHFSQQLYAHALTLQEVIRNEGEVKYTALRPRYDRQAAQQFEIFYHSFNRLSGSRKRAAESCE